MRQVTEMDIETAMTMACLDNIKSRGWDLNTVISDIVETLNKQETVYENINRHRIAEMPPKRFIAIISEDCKKNN